MSNALKAHLNGFAFFPTFVRPKSNKCQEVTQKLDEVNKPFQHDPAFLRTMEQTVEVGQKFDPIQT